MQSTDFSRTSHNEGPGRVETSGMNEKTFTPTDDLREAVDSPSSICSKPKPPVDLQTLNRIISEGSFPAFRTPGPSLSGGL